MKARSVRQLRAVLKQVEVGPFMAFHWAWEVTPARVGSQRGWGVQLSLVWTGTPRRRPSNIRGPSSCRRALMKARS